MSHIAAEKAGLRARIVQDEDPQDPREWDNLGTMVCFHRRYTLGDKHEYRSEDFSGWDEIAKQIEADTGGALILPLYLLDHSGITMRTTSQEFRAVDSAGWDWGQVGFIYVSKADAQKEFGDDEARALEVLRGEVETYDQYLTGEVYGFIVEDERGNELDSCWGFFGMEDVEEQATAALDYCAVHSFMPVI